MKTVLIVEDEKLIRQGLRKMIQRSGVPVEVIMECNNGETALEILKEQSIDVMFTDIRMPKMDGIELVTLIKKDSGLRNIPVMIVSYKDREEDRRRGLDAGADYYLTKGSFHDETLIHAVVDLIGEPWG